MLFRNTLSLPVFYNYVGEDDHPKIADYLLNLNKHQIYDLGLVLGLSDRKLRGMEDSRRFLDDVIIAWLRREDQVCCCHCSRMQLTYFSTCMHIMHTSSAEYTTLMFIMHWHCEYIR